MNFLAISILGAKIKFGVHTFFAPRFWTSQDLGEKNNLDSKLVLLPELKIPGNSYFGGVQPMVAPEREFPGSFLTGAAGS